MPQVHNKKLTMDMDSACFNKNSPFLAAYQFSEQSRHRVKVMNGLDKRICNIKLKFFNKESSLQERKIERVKARLVDNLHKRLAYKVVLRKHPIANAPDYPKPLDGNYSYEALYHEVKDMIHFLRPDVARERRARALIDGNKKRYEALIRENRVALDIMCPPKKRWQPVDFGKFGKKEEEKEEEEKTPSPELTAIEKRNKVSLAGLRRRIIALDDSKPSTAAKTPSRSPTKAPPLSKPPSSNSLMGGKRQGITMSMMKKQRSFMSNKEKTELADTTTGANINPVVADTEAGLATDRTIKTDKKVTDENNNVVTGSVNTNRRKSEPKIPELTVNKSKKKSNLLPPIKQQKSRNLGIDAADIAKSPTLSTGTGSPVKLPVLKMANNTRKEIGVH